MKSNTEKYYLIDDGKRKLKKNYIFSYSFSPGLYDKLCRIELFVKKNMEYELHLFFYEKNLKEFPKANKMQRVFLELKSKLPFEIRQILSQIIISDFKLKSSYYNSKNTFGMLDLAKSGSQINHNEINFSIDLSPDTLDRKIFKSKSEVNFMKLISSTESWLEKLTDNLMASYESE